MRIIIVSILISVTIERAFAGSYSSCEIEGVQHWTLGYTLPDKIEDVHEGVVATFRTENVIALKSVVAEGDYLTATFDKDILTISTTERFKFFEEEHRLSLYSTIIKITLDFECTKYSEDLEMAVNVVDTNNNLPILDRDRYEYHFGMTLPSDYDLTDLFKIEAVDADITNNYVYFTIESNEFLRLGYQGKSNDYGKTHYTTLKTLQEIKAPFRREFTLTATDNGKPVSSTTAKLIVSVSDDLTLNIPTDSGEDDDDTIQLPVFSKHLYFAKYSFKSKLEIDEPITIIRGATINTKITQNNYENYFKIVPGDLTKGEIKVEMEKALPDAVLNRQKMIVIEIEAENDELTIPGRTALIITASPDKTKKLVGSVNWNDLENKNLDKGKVEGSESEECNVTYISGFQYSESSLPIILCLCAIFIVILTNGIVLGLYFFRRKVIESVNNQVIKEVSVRF